MPKSTKQTTTKDMNIGSVPTSNLKRWRNVPRWFWRYRVAHYSVHGTVIFEHRLFREPRVWFDREPEILNGVKLSMVVMDEVTNQAGVDELLATLPPQKSTRREKGHDVKSRGVKDEA